MRREKSARTVELQLNMGTGSSPVLLFRRTGQHGSGKPPDGQSLSPQSSGSFGMGLKADKRNGKVMRRRRHGGAQALLLKGEIRRLRIALPEPCREGASPRTRLLFDVGRFGRIFVKHADERLRLGGNAHLRRNQDVLRSNIAAVEVAVDVGIRVHACAIERDSAE